MAYTKIVIKIGTTTLAKDGRIDTDYIRKISEEISSLVKSGKQIVVVTSGAIGFGAMQLNYTQQRDVVMRQTLAAVGQRVLMNEYAQAFSRQGMEVAQILLTYDIFSNRRTYLNLRNCINNLLKMGIVPIINENDVVSIDEIGTRFGDNDLLSSMVATKLGADLLIMMTDIDGLYTTNPKTDDEARKISIIETITPEIEDAAGKSESRFSVGGMKSKIRPAEMAMKSGCSVAIVHGREKMVITQVLNGENPGTLFVGKGKVSAKRRWLLSTKPRGALIINECAEEVLRKGKSSLLPVGIERVEGTFRAGEVVRINGFARGIAGFSSEDIESIRGMKSSDASKALNRKVKEVVSKENIVLDS